MRQAAIFSLFLLVMPCFAAGPAEAVTAAAADLRTISAEQRPYIRYLTDYTIPEKYRGNFEKALRFHVNSLSRESELVPPLIVSPTLYRVNLAEYGIDLDVWDRLRLSDPYFHTRIQVSPARRVNDRTTPAKFRRVSSPWLPEQPLSYLIRETGSEVPILRADWFWTQTVIQEGRKAGYYDFLGLKNRADFERLVGLDVKRAKAYKREVAAIIQRSGVAQNNRQVFRFGAIDGGSWRTLDVFDGETGNRNAVSRLNGDFTHDAEELYGFLPNGLFAYYLSAADGTAQATAPDKVGPDRTATGNDGRIHAYLSCVRCHKGTLQPLDDYARKLYQPPVGLAVADFEKFKRLRQLYLGELQRHLVKDKQEFEFNLAKLTGWQPADLAASYADWWRWYSDDAVTLERAADELGMPAVQLRTNVLRHAMPPPVGVGRVTPTLAAFAHEPPGTMTRQHWEEAYSEAAQIAYGGIVP